MEALYPYFLVVHLVCAIMFLGVVFCDVMLITPLQKSLGKDLANKVFSAISSRSKYMPLVVLTLILSGGAMISAHLNSEVGYFNTHLQKLLAIKAILALIIVLMIVSNLFCYYVLKRSVPFKKIHEIALILGLVIVVLAKFAFY